ncbi:hypothetical protein BH660_14575 [Bacillus subtilis subsp. subtilis]|nr:hypothetical protein AWM80_19020 [Bacillus subtilis subsp. subtilis]AMS49295.1 hypothetical protein A3772_20020 [Bacillus subtilis]ANJ32487.1 hypothetical protein A8O17_18270 [Bacillus subtilis subsp. subtilis]ANY33580.1 hypothetical protein BEN36_13940 [Bacillus subtilis subsp. subtilis]AOT53062.1 hypothetical protein BH660_14575 [Bacillus subtilis subsp. subtilis]
MAGLPGILLCLYMEITSRILLILNRRNSQIMIQPD